MRTLFIFIFFFLFSFAFLQPAHAQLPDSLRSVVDSALNVMEHRAFNSRRIDWPRLRDSVWRMAAGARNTQEVFPALAYAFDRLGDKHGWITLHDSTHYNDALRSKLPPLPEVYKAVFRKGPKLYNTRFDGGRIAYVSVHWFGGQSEAEMNAFAQRIQDSLCQNISPDTRGLIIDLRLNGGGNCFPMYQGLANVYGDGIFSQGVDGFGRVSGGHGIRNGRVTLHGNHNDSLVLQLARTCGDLSRLPVAVLIGPATGSSAEQLAIAFTSRPRTVLIGERTAGMVTANNGFELPGTGNSIVVAEGLSCNMKGKLFADYVAPDIEVRGGDDFEDRNKDAKVQAALRWLRKAKR